MLTFFFLNYETTELHFGFDTVHLSQFFLPSAAEFVAEGNLNATEHHYMKMNLINESCVPEHKVGCEGLLLCLNNEALVLPAQSLIDKTNNSNESASATGGTFSFGNEFEGRLVIQSAV